MTETGRQGTTTSSNLPLGSLGEQIAEKHLRMKGFRIEARNWRCGRGGEIDLIAVHAHKRLRLFVEVKTRRGNGYGAPAEAVTPAKQARIRSLAERYLTQEGLADAAFDCRFDVISICFERPGSPASLAHLEDAF